jgi:hypothetical protein
MSGRRKVTRDVEVFTGVKAGCFEADDAAGESVGSGAIEGDGDH